MEDCPCRWPPAPAAARSTSSAATSQAAPVSSRRSISRLGSPRVRSMRHESYLAALDPCLDSKKQNGLHSPHARCALPETRVTVYSGYIGNTSGFCGSKVPWQECYKMDERLRFVASIARRREDGGVVPRVRCVATYLTLTTTLP